MSGNNTSSDNCNTTSVFTSLNCGSGIAQDQTYSTIGALAVAIVTSVASAGVQLFFFLILRLRLSRIYQPRSYLVPERERVPIPPSGIVAWLVPLFTTPNLAFIQKCGLDAYFFLRYLRMLLKIFLPLALVLLPVLIPINRTHGLNDGTNKGNDTVSGLDELSISNVAPQHIQNTYWAHLVLALGVVFWVCYVAYRELRGYIRVRQAYLTSPQHRIRASATTVLVTGIPEKWLTLEALSGLYDVFPGGIRNIWINRNFDELASKVSYRDGLAKSLENAETNLIRMCWTKHHKAENENSKKDGARKKTKEEKKQAQADADAAADRMAQGGGVSAGDQHDTPHDLQEAVEDAEADEERRQQQEDQRRNPLGIVGDGFGAVGKGLNRFGRGVENFGQKFVGDVDNGIQKTTHGVLKGVDHANLGTGFAMDDDLYASPEMTHISPVSPRYKTMQMERDTADPAADQSARLERQNDSTVQSQRRSLTHPMASPAPIPGITLNGSAPSQPTWQSADVRFTGPSIESSRAPKSPMEIEEPEEFRGSKQSFWKRWQNHDETLVLPSPQPHTADEDAFPLNASAIRADMAARRNVSPSGKKSDRTWVDALMFWKSSGSEEKKEPEYGTAINSDWDEDQDGEPRWRHYLEPKERETMRLPIFSPTWCPSLPLIGKKVDRIYWTRRELARMNLEIEADQSNVDKFPYMNSAFIQFNHQIAAHMACQSVSHHAPQEMAPRIVEISPDDVLWDNMSIKWWERYVRTFLVLLFCVGLIIFYAVPVSFTSLLSKISFLATRFHWLAFLERLPKVVISIIQGLLPPILLSLILTLVPIIFRLLVKQQGVQTGNLREVYVQQWYFAFLFIQVFLVVTISGGLTTFFSQIKDNPTGIVNLLALDLPTGADYFFSYLTIQAVSNSASALLQVGSLLSWFILAPLLDSTARSKWRRQTSLSGIQWGSFFPPFTNFAVIGIIYAVIAPLILVFMLIIFGLYWIVYRYNVLYVYQFRNDTGGLLFPIAINQLFTGLYLMELFLIGLFFTKKNENGEIVCIPQGAIMIVALVFTVAFQILLNDSFKPLLRYLPITLEDEAVIRDEQFARAQASKFEPLRNDYEDMHENPGGRGTENEVPATGPDDPRGQLAETEKAKFEQRNSTHNDSKNLLGIETTQRGRRESSTSQSPRSPWQQRPSPVGTPRSPETRTDRWRQAPNDAVLRMRNLARAKRETNSHRHPPPPSSSDIEAQHTVGDVLYSGFADELEDLTLDERDLLVRYAFQHSALRAKRPVVWIPRDRLGVSDDEIRRAKRMSTVSESGLGGEREERKREGEKTLIWMSNEGTALDGKGKVVFRRSPPDFSNVDLIAL